MPAHMLMPPMPMPIALALPPTAAAGDAAIAGAAAPPAALSAGAPAALAPMPGPAAASEAADPAGASRTLRSGLSALVGIVMPSANGTVEPCSSRTDHSSLAANIS